MGSPFRPPHWNPFRPAPESFNRMSFVLISSKRFFWPRLNFAIEKGANKLNAIPLPAKRKIDQLMAAGIVTMQNAPRARGLSAAHVVDKKPTRLGSADTAVPAEPPAPRPLPSDPKNAALPPEGGSEIEQGAGEGGEDSALDGETTGEGDGEAGDDEDDEPDGESNEPNADDAKAVLEAGAARQKRGNKRR